jgi:replicative DNA helicase
MSSMDQSGRRLPPCSEEAERAVLGAVLMEPLKFLDIFVRKLKLTNGSFYLPGNRMVWEAVELLYRKSIPIDPLTVADQLKSSGTLDSCGREMFVQDLMLAIPVMAHAEYYAGIVRKKELARLAIREAGEIADLAFETDDPETLIKGASERFMTISSEVVNEVSNADVIDGLCETFEKAADDFRNKRPVKTSGLPLPWSRLNALMNGLQNGMIFIAGRPSQGKTTVALNITDYLSVDLGVPGAWVNMDMQNRGRLFQRMVCSRAGVSLPKLKGGYARDSQLRAVRDAAERIKKAPVYVLDSENNLDVMCAWIRTQVLKHGVKYVAIDYIGLIMTGDTKVDAFPVLRLTIVSARLKNLQGELGIPFLVLSQLSRNSDKEERVPTMSDLRDSGSLEQDAFQVLLAYRNKKWTFELEEQYSYRAQWLDLAKYQDGETAAVEFQFYGPYFSYKEAPQGLFDGLPHDLPPKVEYGHGGNDPIDRTDSGQRGGGVLPDLLY